MSKFAEYDATARQRHPPEATLIRAAVPRDISRLARIAQEREGGQFEEHEVRFEREIGTLPSENRCLFVAENPERGVLGFGRVVRFTPAENAPRNAAPAEFYLAGVIVDPSSRLRGVARALIAARLDWVRRRAVEAWYFVNARNTVSIAAHAGFGFEEVTREFWHPDASFEGGVGILFRLRLSEVGCPM